MAVLSKPAVSSTSLRMPMSVAVAAFILGHLYHAHRKSRSSNFRAEQGKGKEASVRPSFTDQAFHRLSPFFPSLSVPEEKGSTETGSSGPQSTISSASGRKSPKVAVNREFFRQLKAISYILIPRIASPQTALLILQSLFLILRTYLSVVVARLDGRIVKDLIAGDGRRFLQGLGLWFAIAVPATYTNSMIRYLQSKMSISFRTRLTRYAHDLYLDAKTKPYYKVINLDGRMDGADQYITTDISRFCDTLASLFSNIGKPLLDLAIFNYQLARSIGIPGSIGLFVNYIFTASLIRAATPNFGRMAAQEAKLEGDYRSAHSRLITNAEEIAFYHGAPLEQGILQRTYVKLVKHINHVLKVKIGYNMFEDFVIKYCWSAFGLLVCAVPVFRPSWSGLGQEPDPGPISGPEGLEGERTGSRTQGFITNKRLMMSLADAGGRILYSYKELAELAGRTSRVYTLLSVLHSIHRGDTQYVGDLAKGTLFKEDVTTLDTPEGEEGAKMIQFKGVPIVAPTGRGGEWLVEGLNFTLHRGEHLLVTGPNGVGKTGVARIISGLWPIYQGEVRRPVDQQIFYIPQRPYLSLGTLRDQVIYPHSVQEMHKAGRTDEELMDILRAVHLAYLPSREGGWETIKEWKDVFSGGEKQRMNLARLFYHLPKLAVLDECTSAVSGDVEGLMYNHAKELGISKCFI